MCVLDIIVCIIMNGAGASDKQADNCFLLISRILDSVQFTRYLVLSSLIQVMSQISFFALGNYFCMLDL
jgi:hypothetical protein